MTGNDDEKRIELTSHPTIDSHGTTLNSPTKDDAVHDTGKVQPTATPSPPFSIFTKGEKWALIGMAAAAGFFSPMASYIYFPAIPLMADDFHVSVTLMNLTITVYLIFQGISPTFWAPIADTKGRRPVLLACLLLLSVTCIGLAETPTSKWWVLLILRSIQASGSASTVAIGSGVVADLATPAERGGFVGLMTAGPLIGPCIGPILGGVLAGTLGWRWIFWFLCILSSACFVILLLFFPETLRRIVGNGAIPAPWWDRPLIPVIGPYKRHKGDIEHATATMQVPAKKPTINPFRFFLEPDIVFILLGNGLVYALFVCVQATTSVLFQNAYPQLTQAELGLCFLPFGAGCFFSSLVTGKLMNWQYQKGRRKWEAQFRQQRSLTDNAAISKEDELSFPLEIVRLKFAIGYTAVVLALTVAYGWSLDKKGPMALPLIFQFGIGWLTLSQLNTAQTLLIDNFPKLGSSVTAVNNFVRCLIAAGVTAVINLILDGIGTGWTFVLVSGVYGVANPVFTLIVMRWGPKWREARFRRDERPN